MVRTLMINARIRKKKSKQSRICPGYPKAQRASREAVPLTDIEGSEVTSRMERRF